MLMRLQKLQYINSRNKLGILLVIIGKCKKKKSPRSPSAPHHRQINSGRSSLLRGLLIAKQIHSLGVWSVFRARLLPISQQVSEQDASWHELAPRIIFMMIIIIVLSYTLSTCVVLLLKIRACSCLQFVYFVEFLRLVASQLNMYIEPFFQAKKNKDALERCLSSFIIIN